MNVTDSGDERRRATTFAAPLPWLANVRRRRAKCSDSRDMEFREFWSMAPQDSASDRNHGAGVVNQRLRRSLSTVSTGHVRTRKSSGTSLPDPADARDPVGCAIDREQIRPMPELFLSCPVFFMRGYRSFGLTAGLSVEPVSAPSYTCQPTYCAVLALDTSAPA
jgi:hypothetical protein